MPICRPCAYINESPRMRGHDEDVYGERMAEVDQALKVRAVPAEIAGRLRLNPTSSVVEVRRTYKTTSGKIAEVGINLYPADTFRFNMTMRRA